MLLLMESLIVEVGQHLDQPLSRLLLELLLQLPHLWANSCAALW